MMIAVFIICQVMIAGGIPHAFAGDVMIIANTSVPVDTLSPEDVKNIFLGKIVKWPNDDRINIVLNKSADTHKEFLRKYIKRTDSQFDSVWRQNMFTGQGRIPVRKNTDADLVSYVAQTNGAVSYIAADVKLPDGVKILSE